MVKIVRYVGCVLLASFTLAISATRVDAQATTDDTMAIGHASENVVSEYIESRQEQAKIEAGLIINYRMVGRSFNPVGELDDNDLLADFEQQQPGNAQWLDRIAAKYDASLAGKAVLSSRCSMVLSQNGKRIDTRAGRYEVVHAVTPLGEVRYVPTNAQATLFLPGQCQIQTDSPSLFRKLISDAVLANLRFEPGDQLEGGQTVFIGSNEKLTVELLMPLGAVRAYTVRIPTRGLHLIERYNGFQTHPGGIVLPSSGITIRYQQGRPKRFSVFAIDSVVFNPGLSDRRCRVQLPPETTIVDSSKANRRQGVYVLDGGTSDAISLLGSRN